MRRAPRIFAAQPTITGRRSMSSSGELHGGLFRSRTAHIGFIVMGGIAVFAGSNEERLRVIFGAEKEEAPLALQGRQMVMQPLSTEERISLATRRSLTNLKSEKVDQAAFNRYLTLLGVVDDDRRLRLWQRLQPDYRGLIFTKDLMMSTTILLQESGQDTMVSDLFAVVGCKYITVPELKAFFRLLVRLGRIGDVDEEGAARVAEDLVFRHGFDKVGRLSSKELSTALKVVDFTIDM